MPAGKAEYKAEKYGDGAGIIRKGESDDER
jgi:hypothetical protein